MKDFRMSSKKPCDLFQTEHKGVQNKEQNLCSLVYLIYNLKARNSGLSYDAEICSNRWVEETSGRGDDGNLHPM